MCRIGCPIGICVMRRDEFDRSAVFCYSVKFGDKRHHVRHVFDNVTRNDQIKFVIGKWIWHASKIVDHISRRARIVVQPDRTFIFICTATDIENFHQKDISPQRHEGHKVLKAKVARQIETASDILGLNLNVLFSFIFSLLFINDLLYQFKRDVSRICFVFWRHTVNRCVIRNSWFIDVLFDRSLYNIKT